MRGTEATSGADLSVNVLPELEEFTEDEALLARFVVGAARTGGTMFEGRLYECRVARLLGGDLPPRGVWPWDVRLRDRTRPEDCTRIEVRSGAQSFSLSRGRDVHVWVFVAKSNGRAASPPTRYSVAPAQHVAALRNTVGRIKVARAQAEFGSCDEAGLAAAVAKASRMERRYRSAAWPGPPSSCTSATPTVERLTG